MKKLFLTLLLLLCIPGLVWGQSPRATRNLEKLTFDDTNQLKTVAGGGGADGKILDGTAAGQADVVGSNPTGTEQGVVTRNIPSGTQPISASSLPLPVGAATSASQQTDALTDTELRAVAVPISAASLPLPAGAATSAAQLADGHGVASTLVAGLLHANSPTTKVAVLTMIDGSADTDIVTTNLSKSSAITITGSGKIVKVCLVVEGTAPFAEDGTIYFFSADPAIASNTDDMTVAEAITVEVMVSFKGTNYNADFATVKLTCQFVDESFASITHVAYEQEGATTIVNQDFRLLVLYRRNS